VITVTLSGRGIHSDSGSEPSPSRRVFPSAVPLGQSRSAGLSVREATGCCSQRRSLMTATLLCCSWILAAAAPAASLKPAVQPKSAFVPPPASLSTMARQARKIVAQCPPSRVAVLGLRGAGRSSLINLLCSATNPTPNDPRQSKSKQRARANERVPRVEGAKAQHRSTAFRHSLGTSLPLRPLPLSAAQICRRARTCSDRRRP